MLQVQVVKRPPVWVLLNTMVEMVAPPASQEMELAAVVEVQPVLME
jgi:hypothetical protein